MTKSILAQAESVRKKLEKLDAKRKQIVSAAGKEVMALVEMAIKVKT